MPERHKSTFTLIGVAILTQKVRIVYKALAQAKTTSSGDIADIWSGSALGSQGSLLNDQCQPVLRVNLENWLKHFFKERVDQFFKSQMQKVIDVRPVLCLQLAKLVNIRYFVFFLPISAKSVLLTLLLYTTGIFFFIPKNKRLSALSIFSKQIVILAQRGHMEMNLRAI